MGINEIELARFRKRIECEWRQNIAPFWLQYAPDKRYGGFRGWITNDLQIDEQAEKGIILNTRILWTFARAFVLYEDGDALELARRAYEYLVSHFVDRDEGGVFWALDYTGKPLDAKKRVYAQAFAVYSLTEFFVATGEQEALDLACELYFVMENNCRDRAHEGYFETFERDWSLAQDQRLSEVDRDEKKSMNAHLHVLEAYASLARATGDSDVRDRLRSVVDIFLNHIICVWKDDAAGESYLGMFFDEAWNIKSQRRSFGHDIEASWLLCDAAEALGDDTLLLRVRSEALKLAQSVYDRGLDDDGSLLYEADKIQIVDDEKHWWTQTEAVVGFLNANKLSGREYFLTAAWRAWVFIDNHLIDKKHGEWFWKTSRRGQPSPEMPKLSQWKCPYHNGRMCFEIDRRLSSHC
jgi:mannobiose 2-epimerase